MTIRDVTTGRSIPVDPMTRNPYLDPTYAARLDALEDEEGLAGLVPVDRLLALAGGLLGGAITAALVTAYELRRARRTPR